MSQQSEYFDSQVQERQRNIKNYRYFYKLLNKDYQYYIPKGKRVLEVGCGTGHLLAAVEPEHGVGLDISPKMIDAASQNFPHLIFQTGDIKDLKVTEPYDYIILSGLLGDLDDIQDFLTHLKSHTNTHTRVIIKYSNYMWQYILKFFNILRFKVPRRVPNWVTTKDLINFLSLSGYETITVERKVIFPIYIPLISTLFNKVFANLPLINAFCLNNFIIARPILFNSKEYSSTILVPARNEKGNIENAILRTPDFGNHQEFIFVEGGSSDGTEEEIHRIIAKYPEKDIKFYKQTGKGKGDAVRLGFSKAQSDILMILDADLTMPPEDLPKFYNALRDNKGEFINGCRLVYPMEKQAMRFLNLLANKFFGKFFTWLLGQRFKDTLCGTKVLYKSDYEAIVRNRSYFGNFDPFGDFDLIFGATKLNLKVVEVPIRYRDREYGSTQIQRFRHGILLFQMCWFAMKKIRFR